MKTKILISALMLSTVLFSNCKKKDDPAPAPVVNKPVTPPANNTNTNGTLTIGTTVHTYSVVATQSNAENATYYKLNGSSSSNSYPTFTAYFLKGIPTTSHDIDISNQDELTVGFYGPDSYYNAKKGIVKVTVSGTDVSIDFTDVTFTPELVASGHMSSK